MSDKEEAGSLRFIKKVAPSAGPSTYKLSLNNQIIEKSLHHLINVDIDLATSATASQVWRARIIPRKNKDRKEYILQGWKMFCEAQMIRPGDQIAIELFHPKRLVIQTVQPDDEGSQRNSPVRKAPEESMSEPEEPLPPKMAKASEGFSPSMHPEHKACLLEKRNSGALPPCQRQPSASLSNAPASPSNTPTPISSPAIPPAQALPLAQAQNMRSRFSNMTLSSALGAPVPRPPTAALLSSPSMSATSQLYDKEAAFMNDNSQYPGAENVDGADDALLSFLEGTLPNMFDHDLAGLIPGESPGGSASPKLSFGNDPLLNASPSEIVPRPFRHTVSQVSEAQSYDLELKYLVNSIQDRLDNFSRSALHATMGLEHCIVDLSNPTFAQKDAQAKMFSLLSVVKESLWQIMLVAK